MSTGNLAGFDASKVQPASFEPLPIGTYKVVIEKSQMKPTKNGDGQYLNLQLKVIDGQYKGRVLFDLLNLQNKNETAAAIAAGTLSAICHALNIIRPNDSSELHGKPMLVDVGHRKYNKELQNTIKAYKALNAKTSLEVELKQQAEDAPWLK